MKKMQLLLLCKEQKAKQREKAQNTAYNNLQKARSDSSFLKIEKQERELMFEIGKLNAFNGNTTKQTTELNKVRKEKTKILKNLGLTDASLEPNYTCKKCSDTGYTSGAICSCLKTMLNKEIAKQCGASENYLGDFEHLDPELATSEEHKKILKKLGIKFKEISQNFPNTVKFVILSGNTGAGKTYLAGCLANELMKKDHIVSFMTAFAMNNLFLSYHTTFDDNKNAYLDALLDPEVLVIDDLGTEPILKNITLEYLYLIISERAYGNKLTIITTNLSPTDILDRYHERIMSRMLNKRESFIAQIIGSDLRLSSSPNSKK